MANIKFSDFTAQAVDTTNTEFVSYKTTDATQNFRHTIDQVAAGIFAADSGLTAGSVVFAGVGGVLSQDNTNFFWNDTNNRLGIGVNDPDSFLEVFGATTQQKWSFDADSFATMTVADTSNTTLAVGEAGTFTLDVAGNVTIDSDTGVITFADGGASLATVASLRNECFMIACSDETTDITAAADKVRIQMPYAFTLTEIKASLTTAPTGSGATTVNIYNVTDGDTVINTAALSFAAAAISANSTSFTAGQETIAEDAVIAVDVAAIAGTTGGAGLKVTLIGYQTP